MSKYSEELIARLSDHRFMLIGVWDVRPEHGNEIDEFAQRVDYWLIVAKGKAVVQQGPKGKLIVQHEAQFTFGTSFKSPSPPKRHLKVVT